MKNRQLERVGENHFAACWHTDAVEEDIERNGLRVRKST